MTQLQLSTDCDNDTVTTVNRLH